MPGMLLRLLLDRAEVTLVIFAARSFPEEGRKKRVESSRKNRGQARKLEILIRQARENPAMLLTHWEWLDDHKKDKQNYKNTKYSQVQVFDWRLQ